MGNARSTKRDIERARQQKAAAKRERREARTVSDAPAAAVMGVRESQEEILAALAVLHERFERGSVTFDDFEADKTDLMQRLHVD
jgi:hypothetical protein